MSTFEPPDHSHDRHCIFPQELFDRLIDLVEVDSLQHPTLLNFSLVSKAWAHHARKRIFRQVSFASPAQFKLWCKNTAPGPGSPSSLVQILVFFQLREHIWITPSNLLEGEEHLMSFTNLKGLVVFNLFTLEFRDLALLSQCFRVIGRDLNFVRLHHVKGTPRTLTSLLQQFPKARTIAIEYYIEAEDVRSEEPTDETIGPGQFQGCLRLLSTDIDGLAVIDSIARLPLKYEEVNLTASLHFVESYNRLFLACATTLERLRIIDTRNSRCHWANPIDSYPLGITAVSCTELKVVRLGTSRNPGPMLERFLKSISPFNLRELVFELIWDKYVNDDIASVIEIPAWEPIDGALCGLASCIREKHPEKRLNVVLSVVAPRSTDLGKVKLGSLFGKFREEGSIGLQHFTDYLPPGLYSSDMPLLAVGELK